MSIASSPSRVVSPSTDPGDDILVVDDDPANLLAIEVALADLGPRLVKASSGIDALRHLLTQRFALVLLDVQMPNLDGFETARLIRGRPSTRHLPIIFVTAYRREDAQILEGYALGAVDFLFKPIVPEILQAKASVFVQLHRHTDAVAQQAAVLREHEHRAHERRIELERRQWEADVLRREMELERKNALEVSRKAEELERTVAKLEQAEAELTRINHRLAEADRRKDEFLAMLAHELRNPLAPIVNGLAMFRERSIADEELQRARNAMQRQVEHLQRLVDDLLDVSRVTSGKIELRKEELFLSDVIEQAVALSRPLIEEQRHRLAFRPAAHPIALQGDAIRLTQVIANLLNNAARYTDPGGVIELDWRLEGSEAVIGVRDNGRGIAADQLERVFELFVREANDGWGLGLGLTLVERIVKLHGGTVGVRSDGPNRGSRFEVRLPAAVAAGPRSSTAVPEGMATTCGKAIRIVLVEDNPDIRETMQMLLECWGHEVHTACDGSEGVDLVLSARPDVVLVDIGLPEIDGYAVAERVRSELGDEAPRLIALSGFGQRHDRRRSIRCGFEAHLVKPVEPERLRRLLVANHPDAPTHAHADRTSDTYPV